LNPKTGFTQVGYIPLTRSAPIRTLYDPCIISQTPMKGQIHIYASTNEILDAPELFIRLIMVFEIQKHYSVIFLVDFINKYGRPNVNPPFTF